MVTLEQVEKLREYADISYDEAKVALENADGDILQALIDLERQGKVKPPQGGGKYRSEGSAIVSTSQPEYEESARSQSSQAGEKSAFSRNMRKLLLWMGDVLHKGNVNAFAVMKEHETIMKLPITVLVLLLIFAFWIILPLIIVGLFFGFRYLLIGPDIKSSTVNDAMNNVANAADEIKKDINK